jgi:aspartate 1-decarboxylase
MLRAKIHRVTVTHTDLEYEGSITLSPELLRAADILEYEAVQVWNVTNGARFETYAIKGESGSSVVCVNGAAAHHAHPGDVVIVGVFADFAESDLASYRPRIVFVDGSNRQIGTGEEIAGPLRRARL